MKIFCSSEVFKKKFPNAIAKNLKNFATIFCGEYFLPALTQFAFIRGGPGLTPSPKVQLRIFT
jgi:hypothetical protein